MKIGPYRIASPLKFFAALLVFFSIIGGLIYWQTRPEVVIDASPNLESEFQTKFTYPFRDDAMRDLFASRATTYNSGAEIASVYPGNTGIYPSAFGTPAHFYALFVGNDLDPSAPASFQDQEGFQYYRAVIVPSDDPRTFSQMNAVLSEGEPETLLNYQPVMLGFREGFTPPLSVRYIEVLALYYWGSARMDVSAPVHLPTLRVGDFSVVGESSILNPPDNVIPASLHFTRNDLDVKLSGIEFSDTSTRVAVDVYNDTSATIEWNWSDQTFLLVDDKSSPVIGGDDQVAGSQASDQIGTTFPPGRTTGFIFFPRQTLPKSKLVLNFAMPGDDGTRSEFNFNLNLVENVAAERRAVSES